jgi:PncC family amidohydrolase
MAESDSVGLVRALAAVCEQRRLTVATAESCTGGGVAAAITDLPGVSSFFLGGIVSYANEVKEQALGVPGDVLAAHGAVSEPTARAMAAGVRERIGADVGISTTGIAGPDGGTPTKPVGLVFIAVSTPDTTLVRQDVWPGDRAEIRRATVLAALQLTLQALAEQK